MRTLWTVFNVEENSILIESKKNCEIKENSSIKENANFPLWTKKKSLLHVDSISVDDGNNDGYYEDMSGFFQLFSFHYRLANYVLMAAAQVPPSKKKKCYWIKILSLSFSLLKYIFHRDFSCARVSNDFQVQWMKINNWKTASNKKSVARKESNFPHLYKRRQLFIGANPHRRRRQSIEFSLPF